MEKPVVGINYLPKILIGKRYGFNGNIVILSEIEFLSTFYDAVTFNPTYIFKLICYTTRDFGETYNLFELKKTIVRELRICGFNYDDNVNLRYVFLRPPTY